MHCKYTTSAHSVQLSARVFQKVFSLSLSLCGYCSGEGIHASPAVVYTKQYGKKPKGNSIGSCRFWSLLIECTLLLLLLTVQKDSLIMHDTNPSPRTIHMCFQKNMMCLCFLAKQDCLKGIVTPPPPPPK